MPSRVIRDGLLDSQRYWSVTIEARELYRHLQLLADDFGCVSLAPVYVRRRCFYDSPSDAFVDNLIEQLLSADLVRLYTHNGARYGFVPRFRQRLQRMTLKHPAPPPELLTGDDDAKEKFAKVQADSRKDNRSLPVGQPLPTVGHPPKGSEVELRKEVESKTGAASGWRAWAKEHGITPAPGESDLQFQVRVSHERQRAKEAS